MAERDPLIDERKGLSQTSDADNATGAKAAAEGAGNPAVASVGSGAESHHIAHAGSKAGEREDVDDVECSGDEGNHKGRDVINQNPVADEQKPAAPRATAP